MTLIWAPDSVSQATDIANWDGWRGEDGGWRESLKNAAASKNENVAVGAGWMGREKIERKRCANTREWSGQGTGLGFK